MANGEQRRRFASPFSGSEGMRNKMRHVLYANRKRRLRKLGPPGDAPSGAQLLVGADGENLLGSDGAQLWGYPLD